ncbi:MAG: galactosyldiacylglycerol synthase [Bacteroidia bacterium]|nr:MAG: galactosyldiacylglycerol synthase [Bacteroidia bacterium]
MKPLSFLILSATGGAGHLRAAAALEHAAETMSDLTCEHFDCLDFTSKTFKHLYAGSYLAMVNKAPELWGYLYSRAQMKPYEKKGLLKVFDDLNYREYVEFLKRKQPDAILCTHFLPYISISGRLRSSNIKAPVFAVTTDFDAHQYWVDSVVDRYYVHTEESAWQLRAKGAPADRIRVLGIPVMPDFAKRQHPAVVRRQLGLPDDRLTILMVWGGFGVGKPEKMVQEVLAMLQMFPQRHFTLVAVCGRNEKLRRHLEKTVPPPNVLLRGMGFVENIHAWMNACDLLISKAGGLTSAEAMAMGTPMLIVDPIPGQETRNTEIIVEERAGWKALDIPNIGYKIKRILEQPGLLDEAREATARLARPNAARDILLDAAAFVRNGGIQ